MGRKKEFEAKSGVYLISNQENGRVYVGISLDLHSRQRVHTRLLNLGKHHNQELQSDWSKFGEQVFDFELAEPISGFDSKALYEKEKEWITKLQQDVSLYNVPNPQQLSAESRRRNGNCK